MFSLFEMFLLMFTVSCGFGDSVKGFFTKLGTTWTVILSIVLVLVVLALGFFIYKYYSEEK
ncbi:hypothetical protein H312_02264 [Anncaliia algerae PRA339]|uniref:Uncharacterized protein n=1 Tax=Anncaliia algerae PRA339 TaxID=1288291 RepID=A0A059EZN5_9MICR|nr:hypothetical protein H312_02264 [Anncaliia algerae PRA339]